MILGTFSLTLILPVILALHICQTVAHVLHIQHVLLVSTVATILMDQDFALYVLLLSLIAFNAMIMPAPLHVLFALQTMEPKLALPGVTTVPLLSPTALHALTNPTALLVKMIPLLFLPAIHASNVQSCLKTVSPAIVAQTALLA